MQSDSKFRGRFEYGWWLGVADTDTSDFTDARIGKKPAECVLEMPFLDYVQIICSQTTRFIIK